MDADAGEAFDSMLNRDARFWGEIAARKVFAAAAAAVLDVDDEEEGVVRGIRDLRFPGMRVQGAPWRQ